MITVSSTQSSTAAVTVNQVQVDLNCRGRGSMPCGSDWERARLRPRAAWQPGPPAGPQPRQPGEPGPGSGGFKCQWRGDLDLALGPGPGCLWHCQWRHKPGPGPRRRPGAGAMAALGRQTLTGAADTEARRGGRPGARPAEAAAARPLPRRPTAAGGLRVAAAALCCRHRRPRQPRRGRGGGHRRTRRPGPQQGGQPPSQGWQSLPVASEPAGAALAARAVAAVTVIYHDSDVTAVTSSWH